jgi:hypothetical protein
MCDGSRGVTGNLILCTDSFTVPDVVRLMNLLLIRYNMESSLTYSDGLPRIAIPVQEVPKVIAIVHPYMHPFFLYKLGIGYNSFIVSLSPHIWR